MPIFVVGVAALAAAPAAAHDKTDIVVLDNDDRFHGEIRKMELGSLTLKTNAAGTVTLKWSHVASVESRFEFQVEATSGRHFFGTLAKPGKKGQLEVVGPAGTHTLPLEDVFWLAPVERGFWRKLHGSVEFGFSYTQSNEAVQYSLSADSSYLTRKTLGDLQLNSIFNTQKDAESASQHSLSAALFRSQTKRMSAFALALVQSNPNQGFDLRSSAGGGVGLYARRTNGGFVLVSAGLLAAREDVTGSSRVDTNVEALVGLRFSSYRSDFPTHRITLGLNTFTNITNTPRFRAQLNFKISLEIIHHLNVSLNVLDSYDSRPPTADASKNDLSITSSLGYSF